jgi:hypothetical protein
MENLAVAERSNGMHGITAAEWSRRSGFKRELGLHREALGGE